MNEYVGGGPKLRCCGLTGSGWWVWDGLWVGFWLEN